MKNFEAREQISNLGLMDLIADTSKKSGLDVGCGKDFLLVKELRELGLDVEGIDPKLDRDYEGLIKRAVSRASSHRGIPRPNNFYDFVTIHQNPYMNMAYGPLAKSLFLQNAYSDISHERFERLILAFEKKCQAMILESLRVLKNSGRLIIYPAIINAESVLSSEPFYSRAETFLEPVNPVDDSYLEIYHEDPVTGFVVEDVSLFATRRTVLKKR